MPSLIIRAGKYRGKTLQLPSKTVTVGRDESCEVRLTTQDVSRRHCCIEINEQGMIIRDLGSRNRTLVNGEVIEGSVTLVRGDEIQIGGMLFEVHDTGVVTTDSAPEAESGSLAEDDIAHWLSDDDGDASGDTTVIQAVGPADFGDEPAAPSAEVASPVQDSAPRKIFHSIAEEAEDIIRRHDETLASLENGE